MVINLENINPTAPEAAHQEETADSQIREILEKNLELTEEIYKICKKMNSYFVWQQIFGILKVLIIVIPIIIGIIYLPPLLKPMIQTYQEALGSFNTAGQNLNSLQDLNKQLDKIKGVIK